jgi:hypothetical protein
MRISIDIPPDIEKALLEKCEKAKISPSEFVLSLLDWYFLKRKKEGSESEFMKIAKQCAAERVRYCKYSDGRHCAREVFSDILEEKEPEPIVPYKCLFCPYFVDRRAEKPKTRDRDIVDRTYDIARLAAKLVVELYGDKLGYRPKLPVEEMEEEERKISKQEVKKLLENW